MNRISKSNLNLVCHMCGKSITMGNNKPKSQHKTRRVIKPNVQKIRGMIICTRCLRTLNKYAVA